MTQGLKTENEILMLNQIKSQRFEADSIKAYFFVVNADNLHDFIQYDSRELKSETHLRILSESGVSADSELQNETAPGSLHLRSPALHLLCSKVHSFLISKSAG